MKQEPPKPPRNGNPSGLRLQDSNLVLTAPKAVVLPLHQGGPLRGAVPVCQTANASPARLLSLNKRKALQQAHGPQDLLLTAIPAC